MPEVAAEQTHLGLPPITLALAFLAGALLAATITLWAHYGTAVFYEVIAAGIAACF